MRRVFVVGMAGTPIRRHMALLVKEGGRWSRVRLEKKIGEDSSLTVQRGEEIGDGVRHAGWVLWILVANGFF